MGEGMMGGEMVGGEMMGGEMMGEEMMMFEQQEKMFEAEQMSEQMGGQMAEQGGETWQMVEQEPESFPEEVVLNDLDTSSVWDASLSQTALSAMGAERKYARLKTRDLVFQTLDTTMRQIRFPNSGRTAVVADSVGFIQNLPHYLFDAFASTIKVTETITYVAQSATT
jgi:hypothetical protein